MNRALLSLVFALISCGGGTAAAPQPVSSDPLPGGRVWHDSAVFDDAYGRKVEGIQVNDFKSSTPQRVLRDGGGVIAELGVWPDGERYVIRIQMRLHGVNVINTYATKNLRKDDKNDAMDSNTPISSASFVGTFNELLPHPKDKNLVLLTSWWRESVSAQYHILYDIRQAKPVMAWNASDMLISWTHDGNIIDAKRDGSFNILKQSGEVLSIGKLKLPNNSKLASSINVAPSGDRFIVALRTGDVVDKFDGWIGRFDNSALERFTATQSSSRFWWSPDGRYIAYDAAVAIGDDQGNLIGGAACAIRIAEASERNVTSANKRGIGFKGADAAIGCPILAWTQ